MILFVVLQEAQKVGFQYRDSPTTDNHHPKILDLTSHKIIQIGLSHIIVPKV